jgi:4-diphosphocytidyl-2-C-methyl-D-erythritol kinase
LEHGALGALMSGSGPSVFGLFEKRADAKDAAKELRFHNKAKDIIVTTIFNRERL